MQDRLHLRRCLPERTCCSTPAIGVYMMVGNRSRPLYETQKTQGPKNTEGVAALRSEAVALAIRSSKFLRVKGGCMCSVAPDGASVRVEACPPSDLRAGDVVLVHRSGSFFLHRLLKVVAGKDGCRLLTKGDAARRPDAPFPLQHLAGRLAEVRANGKSRCYRPSFLQRAWSTASGLLWWFFLRLKAAVRRDPRPQ